MGTLAGGRPRRRFADGETPGRSPRSPSTVARPAETFTRQAADEFPGALAALREQLPVDDGPVGVLGGSLGGAVALQVLTAGSAPVRAAALVNPAVRMRTPVAIVEGLLGQPYAWTTEAERVADELDFVARAAEVTGPPPLLLVSGELDFPVSRTDAADLVRTLRDRSARPDDVELTTVPALAHPLAEEPGLEPAPQLPTTAEVDRILTRWFVRRLAPDRG